MKKYYLLVIAMAALLPMYATEATPKKSIVPPVIHSKPGQTLVTDDKNLNISLISQRHGYGKGASYDPDIASPKSVTFSKDGGKFYVNSLEGCKTVVYSRGGRKLKVIKHTFPSGTGSQWLPPSGYYNFTHYRNGEQRAFSGKPVESCLSRDGRYLFVPYYRRTFDVNAQDPSALAVIDTRSDSIVLMMETGPLPKMVSVSHDGKTLAVTHWGNNTVGLVDISSPDPRKWHHLQPVTVHHVHPLNYPLDRSVDRDSGSGYSLRGTLFLPGDSLLLVSGMGGSVAVIAPRKSKWLGWLPQLHAVRHIVLSPTGQLLFSRNSAGEVVSLPLDSLLKAVRTQRGAGKEFTVKGLRRVKVGGGTRTIELSPSGKYLFAACNTASALYVVDTESMQVIGKTPVDSYPVGLDVSPDGSMVIVTSQGRKGFGGNAVNIFMVDYAEPEVEPVIAPTENDTARAKSVTDIAKHNGPSDTNSFLRRAILFTTFILILLVSVIAVRKRKLSNASK